jgi:hypothetical protein
MLIGSASPVAASGSYDGGQLATDNPNIVTIFDNVYYHYAGYAGFNLTNNMDGGTAVGLLDPWSYYQFTTYRGTIWGSQYLGWKPFYNRSNGSTWIPAHYASLGATTLGSCAWWQFGGCDTYMYGYLNY